MQVDSKWIDKVLHDLVRCDSVNPAFTGADGSPGRGEAAIAEVAAGLLREIGLEVTVDEVVPGRPNVVGRLPGSGGGRSLLLNGHLDTVGSGSMQRPFEPRVEGSRLYGRGAYDMKGGVAACLGALAALASDPSRLRGEVLVTLVVDEEDASIGTARIAKGCQVDGAIVAEPTELRLCLAHKGFTWLRITTEGFACHGSDYRRGVDANVRMGAVLAGLGELAQELLERDPHPLVGPPSMHVPLVNGGEGPSIYSPSCTAHVERRTVPGERDVADEIHGFLRERLDPLASGPVEVVEELVRGPFEARSESALATSLQEAFSVVNGEPPEVIGVPFWTDAALLQAQGVDTVVFGTSGDGAHQDVEWVDLDSVERCSRVILETARRYCD